MLFDDPVDTSGKEVTELPIPPAPPAVAPETAQNLPQNKGQVINRTDSDLKITEVEEDNPNSTLDSPNSPEESGAATGQAGMPETSNTANSDMPANQPVEASNALPAKQPGLDTGYIEGKAEPKDTQTDPEKQIEPDKARQQTLIPVEKPVSKPIMNEKSEPEATGHPVKSEEKSKRTVKPEGNKAVKSSSKFARYSIQAGSFTKKENAEAMVAKLRKQGLPATIISKGEHYRVKVGPSLDKAKAKEMKAKMEKLNINGLLTLE
jgi:DedD protein